MELNMNLQENYHLKKILFNLKSNRSDGLMLQVHHSYSDSAGESKRYRFIHASFSSNGSHLAVSDHKGHVFIINLDLERYWQLPQVGLPTIISFPILRNQELLIGLENTSILFIHIETGYVTGVLQGHSVPAAEVSYSDDGYYYLTSSNAEAIVWDSSTYTQIHRLSLKVEVRLKKVLFMPITNHILACFQDDTMHVWKFKSFECIKQIIPDTSKTHHVKAIAITKNGRAMVIGGHSSNLVIFCLDTWAIKNVVEFPDNIPGIKQLEFLSQVFDGGANKLLVVLTTSQELLLFDIEALIFLKWFHRTNELTAKFSLSCNGKYLLCILTTGEINIYKVEKMLPSIGYLQDMEKCIFNQNSSNRIHSSSSKRTQKSNESLSTVQKEIKDVLDVKKLLPILKQFGEYPYSYRTLIWKVILKLPENKESFVSLSLKKCHPSYSKLELKYPLANKSLCNTLKKLLSNISHWCPLFGEVDFLPEFVFPFVKLFHSSPLDCFEVVATVIINWCQNWFEFYPFPPVNMLSVLESILGYHDPSLLQFYLTNNVTSSVTVCPLFHTAFSEVLSKTEWLKLWDHVLSNEPSFLFMAIIAYNVVCQNAIRNLQKVTEIEKFFHTQNPVDLKTVIWKAYYYLKETPEDIHTRQFFSTFRTLGTGGAYISFLAYPKLIVDSNAEKLKYIRKEEDKILDEQFKALNMKKTLEKKLQHHSKSENKEKIIEELEEKIRKTVEDEEDRLLIERRKLLNLRQELKLKELEVLENTKDKALKEKIRQKEIEFERLLKDISKRKLREKAEVDVIEQEIRNYYSDLLLRKYQLELDLGLHKAEANSGENLEIKLQKLKSDSADLQYEWSDLHHNKRIDLCNKITAIKNLISNVEMELANEIMEKSGEKYLENDRHVIQDLRLKVNFLEDKVENLIKEDLKKLRTQKQQQKTVDYFQTKPDLYSGKNENKNSNQKWEGKNAKSMKAQRTLKYITKSTSPGSQSNVRKITTIRTRVPGTRSQHVVKEKNQSKTLVKNLDDCKKKGTGNLRSKKPTRYIHHKSKFTCPSELQKSSSESLECYLENSKRFNLLSDSDSYSETRKNQQQPLGDCLGERSFNLQKRSKNKKTGKVSKFTIKKDVSVSNSEEEIFKSALKTRSDIVEEAKRRQLLQ